MPLGRLGESEEVAWLATSLASDAADDVDGTVMTLDGGRNTWRGTWPPAADVDDDGRPVSEARPNVNA